MLIRPMLFLWPRQHRLEYLLKPDLRHSPGRDMVAMGRAQHCGRDEEGRERGEEREEERERESVNIFFFEKEFYLFNSFSC